MSNLQSAVETTIQNMVAVNQLFTTLDVTTEVRKSGVRCKNAEVRDIVRQLFTDSKIKDYTRGNILVLDDKGDYVETYLYYPSKLSTKDVENLYGEEKRKPHTTAAPKPGVIKNLINRVFAR